MAEEEDSEFTGSEKQHFIEEISLVFEEIGLPRMAGRIIGWLLICTPSYQSAEELAGALQASRGSISTMTRLLIEMDLVERIGLPGERRGYFRVKSNIWSRLLRDKMGQVTYLHQLAERGLQLVESESPEFQRRLLDMHDLYSFVEQELPVIIARWEQERYDSK